MKRYLYIVATALVVFSLQACESDEDIMGTDKELTLSSTVEGMKTTGTRALGDEFFETGNQIEVDLTFKKSDGTVIAGTESYTYAYGSDRIFRGNPGYKFLLDDSYIGSLTAKWPTSAVRAANGIKTDQRQLADYKAADWMSGGLLANSEGGIVATDAPVPLVFKRENIMLDFELVGQNTTGLDIESLLIELQNTEGAQAYWAYCDTVSGHAKLILPDGSKLLSKDNYLIGRVRVSGQTEDYTIVFPETEIAFEAGYRYLITLTPQGYFMNAYVYISGFQEAEEGIGIPFQQPTPDINGNFNINTSTQLTTLSYLIRNYNDGTTFVWSGRTYVISDALTLTVDEAAKYIPIPQSIFTGRIQNESGIPIEEVPVEGGGTLALFDSNN